MEVHVCAPYMMVGWQMLLPLSGDSLSTSSSLLLSSSSPSFSVDSKFESKLLGEAWLAYLKLSHPVPVYKNILVHLHTHILPRLPSPLMVADFLTDSYNVGGVVSLLALNGLFLLITKHNLDYPKFFDKLCKRYICITTQAAYACRTYFIYKCSEYVHFIYPSSVALCFSFFCLCRYFITAICVSGEISWSFL